MIYEVQRRELRRIAAKIRVSSSAFARSSASCAAGSNSVRAMNSSQNSVSSASSSTVVILDAKSARDFARWLER